MENFGSLNKVVLFIPDIILKFLLMVEKEDIAYITLWVLGIIKKEKSKKIVRKVFKWSRFHFRPLDW